MFTWICPQCGREVPPSYTECPDCAARAKTQPPPPPQPEPPPPQAWPPQQQPPPPQARPPAPEPPPPQYQAAPPQYPPQQYPPQQYQYPPQYQQAQYQPPPPTPPSFYPPPPERKGLAGLPTWLLSILFAVGFGVVVLGLYYLVNYKKQPAAAADSAASENPAAATAAGGARNNPVLKQIEVVGLRLTQNRAKKTEVRFVVVNHSGAEIQELGGAVSLQARTSKKDEEPIGTFTFKVPALGPYESKEVTALLNTKLKVYELPDWQNLEQQLQITSP